MPTGNHCVAPQLPNNLFLPMIEAAIRLLFRCSHKRITLPMTPARKPGAPAGEPYVVCLDCGGKFAYDWVEMRMGRPLDSGAEGDGRTWLSRLLRKPE